jgi:hypothetical protein
VAGAIRVTPSQCVDDQPMLGVDDPAILLRKKHVVLKWHDAHSSTTIGTFRVVIA